MKFLQNKAALLITALGLLLGLSFAKIYQQRQIILELEQFECPEHQHPHFNFGEHINIDIPNLDLQLDQEFSSEIFQHEEDLEEATKLMKEEMARLQEEYERMLSEHHLLIETHIDKAKQRRAE